MRYQYYFTAGARFPEPGHEMDAFLFIDREALLREKAVYELSDGVEKTKHATYVATALAGMELRAAHNVTMSPVLMLESDELLTKDDIATFVETTPWEELIKLEPPRETT